MRMDKLPDIFAIPERCPECGLELLEPRPRLRGRVLPYECFACGWQKDYPITENRAFDLPDE